MFTSQPRPTRLRFLQRRQGRIALLACAVSLAPAAVAPSAPSFSAVASARAQGLSGRTASVSIDGTSTEVTPRPVITKTGSVLVPLRGVLEKLQANVNYVAADKRIEVRQKGKTYILREGQQAASVGTESVAMPAAPQRIGNSVFVPLRALAELFGYRVEWDNATKTVLIDTATVGLSTANHVQALSSARRFGVGIDFTDLTVADVPALLDSAKATGVDIIQTRFDWNTVQPTKGGPFDFSLYDAVVAEARKRNMVVVGILGGSARWASQTTSENPFEWRYNAPKKAELPAWSAYVRATVARFRNDVHAWQVWDQPASWKLRASGYAGYAQLVAPALQAARLADGKAIVRAAEPGGVNLTYLNAIKSDPALSALDGVNIYPASQWQPGLPVAPEDQILPLNAYQSQLQVGPSTWIGGLWYPAVEKEGVARPEGPQFSKASDKRREEIYRDFTPQEQADYLVKSAVLAVATGADKVMWNALRDAPAYEGVEPINPEWGSGLLRRDNSPRPAYNALANMARLIGDPKFKFIGALANGPDVVALAFDDGESGHVVAWSPSGRGRITVNDTQDPKVPGAVYIGSRADSQLLLSNGDPANLVGGAFTLTQRPLWITKIASDTAARAKEARGTESKYLSITRPLPRSKDKNVATATFGDEGKEDGLLWRKYAQWRGQATRMSQVGDDMTIVTEIPPSALNPADGKPFVFFDVADDFSFFNRSSTATPTITVRLKKAAANRAGALSSNTAGFKVEYSTLNGNRATRWQEVEEGEGFVQYSFDLPGAVFSNTDGSDITLSAFGSKQPLYISSVTLTQRAS